MRIVSQLPSTTEILFAIGAGEDVVGVTFECADRVWLSLDAALDANPWKP